MATTSQKQKRQLLSLPTELLVAVFKTQSSIRDAVHLAQACKLLQTVYQAKANKIPDTILQNEFPCYDQLRLLITAEEATSSLIRTAAGGNYKTLYHLAMNARTVLEIATSRYSNRRKKCNFHKYLLPNQLMPHEQNRVAYGFYFIKLYISAHCSKSRHLQRQLQFLDEELDKMGIVQLNVLFEMFLVIDDLMSSGKHKGTPVACYDPDEHSSVYVDAEIPNWYSAMQAIWQKYSTFSEMERTSIEKRMNGPCDGCPAGRGNFCKPRDHRKGIWEL